MSKKKRKMSPEAFAKRQYAKQHSNNEQTEIQRAWNAKFREDQEKQTYEQAQRTVALRCFFHIPESAYTLTKRRKLMGLGPRANIPAQRF